MIEDEPSEHGEVVSNLMDLQRRLRGGETVEVSEADVTVQMTPGAAPPPPPPPAAPILPSDERFAPVTQLPTSAGGDDRMSALTERLGRLEHNLSGVLGSIDSISGDASTSATPGVDARLVAMREETDARMTAMQEESDARAAGLMAERLAAVSDRLTDELDAQRRDLAGLLDRRIESMEASLREAIRDVSALRDGDDRQPKFRG